MITKEIINRIKLLVGLRFTYQGSALQIVNWHIDGDQLEIKTTTKHSDLKIHIAHAKEFFSELVPLDERGQEALAGIEPTSTTVAAPTNDVAALLPTGTLTEINAMLLDSIRKVQLSADYIPQAKAISDSVQVVVNVAKMQIDAAKIVLQARRK